jgi:sugar lactone lactonase YvrE
VELVGSEGKPLVDQLVWLIPTNQPGGPIGLHTDENGRAWFWCKAGAGKYIAYTQVNGKPYQAEVVPAVAGEWMQIKTVRCSIAPK